MKKTNIIYLLPVWLLLIISTTLPAQQARLTILFNDGWKFHKGEVSNGDKPTLNDADWRQVNLPHDWSIEGPFDEQWASATAYLPAGIGWYRKTFELGPNLPSKNIFLYFDGVYKNSEVWINGHYLGKRPNGFIPFQYEITPYLNDPEDGTGSQSFRYTPERLAQITGGTVSPNNIPTGYTSFFRLVLG
ncbi:MAG: hypothetical protein ICV81_12760, partial [Flavisolibacter sp.]|nr:hypothetical protein [Flavisolibacter sp.]